MSSGRFKKDQSKKPENGWREYTAEQVAEALDLARIVAARSLNAPSIIHEADSGDLMDVFVNEAEDYDQFRHNASPAYNPYLYAVEQERKQIVAKVIEASRSKHDEVPFEYKRGHRRQNNGMNEREALVLRRRFALDGMPEQTLEEVAEPLEVTRERIRQIEDKAMRKFRGMLREQGITPDALGLDGPEQ